MNSTPLPEIITIESDGENSVLQQPTHKVTFPLSNTNKTLINAMREQLYHLSGVGLAAPQVGSNQCILAVYIPEDAALLRDNAIPYPMHMLINAEYEGIEEEGKNEDFEACYSVSSKAGKVSRYNAIKLSYQDEHGEVRQSTETGLYARVLQHEIDHINGLLITDRLTSDSVQGTLEEMIKMRREQLSPEKQKVYDQHMQKKLQK